MDEDFTWPCTQAVCTDDQPNEDRGRANHFGCIVFDDAVGHKMYELEEGDNTVGRHQFNHIYIEHPSVSMYHAVIQCDSDGVVLKDEGSLNKTKINKKTLKKDVAYFLEENALLMFGEVRANYYVNGESSNIANEVKANASNKTSLGNITENADVFIPLLSNTVLTSDSFFTKKTPGKFLDVNASSVIVNNSTNEIEKKIIKTINEFEYNKKTHDDIHAKLNCSSPSDELLLDAVSQIENEAMYKVTQEETSSPVMDFISAINQISNISKNPNKTNSVGMRQTTPSPVMDFQSSFSTINQISNNISENPNNTNSVEMREDTPSPVMDFKSSFSTTNQISKNISQTPNKTNSNDIREDTPSPVMDLGIFEKIEISNHNTHSTNESTNNIKDFNETQCLETNTNFTQDSTREIIPKNVNTHISKSSDYTNRTNEQSLPDECTQLPTTYNENLQLSGTVSIEQNMSKNYINTFDSDDDYIFFDVAQIVKNSKKTEKLNINLLDNNNAHNVSSSNKINSSGNSITKNKNNSVNKRDDFNCPNPDKSMSSFSQYLTNTDTHKNSINSFEMDDDDIFRNFITENSTFEFESQNLIKRDDENCFNCPTQKVSISKKIHSTVSSTTYNDGKQTFSKSVLENKPNLNNTKHTDMDDDLTLAFNNEDFFNCPTQKMSNKKKTTSIPNLSPSTYEEETQQLSEFAKSSKVNSSNSKNCVSYIKEDLTQNPELEDEDFFNCPTQKVSITNKMKSISKISPSQYEAETQKLSGFNQPKRADSSGSKHCTTILQKDLTQIPELEDDDFFNCPTQKVSITSKGKSISKLSLSPPKAETQKRSEFNQSKKTDSSDTKHCTTNDQMNLTCVSELEDEDFFNCPTQKVSITSKGKSISKLSLSPPKAETQKRSEFNQPKTSDSSDTKHCTTNDQMNLTCVSELEDEDFFNCPTQKVSITSKGKSISKLSLSLPKAETQKRSEFNQPIKTDSSDTKHCITNDQTNLTCISELEDEDFFNCPTQKVSITSKGKSISKLSLSPPKAETQKRSEFNQPKTTDSSDTKHCTTNDQMNLTCVSELEDEDFFNCPTQKVSITSKGKSISKLSLSLPKAETQKRSEFNQPKKTDSSDTKHYTTILQKDLTQIPELEDDDFFNCPTQKVSNINKMKSITKLPPSLYDAETQKPSDIDQPRRADSSDSKHCTTNDQMNLTRVSELEDEDFFDCPTQKISITNKMKSISKLSPSLYEAETQKLSELNQPRREDSSDSKNYTTNLQKDSTQVPKLEDEDFFNCPTQKVSSKEKSISKLSLSPSKAETQKHSEFNQTRKVNLSDTKHCVTNQMDLTKVPELEEDFINCPTQKLSSANKMKSISKLSSSLYEAETQKLSKLNQPRREDSSDSKNYTTSLQKDLTQIPELEDDDFFNCPTQKLSSANKMKSISKLSSSLYEAETQKLSVLKQPNEIVSCNFKRFTTLNDDDLTQIPEINNEDIFNRPTQKMSSYDQTIFTTNTKSMDTNEYETRDLIIQPNSRISVFNMSSPDDNKRLNKENIFECTVPNKIQSISLNKDQNDVNASIVGSEGLSIKKRTCLPKNVEKNNIRRSMRLDSDKSNIHLLINSNENLNSSKSSKPNKKPIRGDLHKSSIDNVNMSLNNNKMNYPTCSKTTIVKDQNLISSVEQEPLMDVTSHCQVLNSHKYKPQSKQMTETLFSSSNTPHVSTNLLQENSISVIESNSDALNCKPSSSNNIASKWKSFWNKKKTSIQDKEKSDGQGYNKSTNNIVKKGYQTRAITKKENAVENSKKRKQDNVNVENDNKRMCDEHRELKLNPLDENRSEFVVTFSYLKNRKLKEMIQFVDITGGSVTDEMSQCTVLVTDKIRCTMKILSAIAKGCPIVNVNWLKHSYVVRKFQDVDEFIITDKDAERKYRFQLKESLNRARINKLLEGYTVLVTPSVKPSPKEMKVIITCAGGKFVVNWPRKRAEKELIVTCDQDRKRWKSLWDNDTAKVVDSDTLVMSIIRQKLNV